MMHRYILIYYLVCVDPDGGKRQTNASNRTIFFVSPALGFNRLASLREKSLGAGDAKTSMRM